MTDDKDDHQALAVVVAPGCADLGPEGIVVVPHLSGSGQLTAFDKAQDFVDE
jgi:hypothetical protein